MRKIVSRRDFYVVARMPGLADEDLVIGPFATARLARQAAQKAHQAQPSMPVKVAIVPQLLLWETDGPITEVQTQDYENIPF